MRNGRRRLHITNVEAKLGRLKRLLLALLATGAGVAITIVGPAGLANAAQVTPMTPSSCSAWTLPGEGGEASCPSGTGHFRVELYCTSNPQVGYGNFYFGPWELTGQYDSIEFCPISQPYVVAAGYDLANW
jgi:hypothetical protein